MRSTPAVRTTIRRQRRPRTATTAAHKKCALKTTGRAPVIASPCTMRLYRPMRQFAVLDACAHALHPI
jgi:hypothetical protein